MKHLDNIAAAAAALLFLGLAGSVLVAPEATAQLLGIAYESQR